MKKIFKRIKWLIKNLACEYYTLIVGFALVPIWGLVSVCVFQEIIFLRVHEVAADTAVGLLGTPFVFMGGMLLGVVATFLAKTLRRNRQYEAHSRGHYPGDFDE